MKINIKQWKEFNLSSLLTIINGTGITKEEIIENPGDFIAVQSGEENNGVLGNIDLEYCKKMNYKYTLEPCLTVARSGTAGFVSYQPNGCVVGDSAKILLLPSDYRNEYVYLFIQTILTENRYRYTYGRKVTFDNYSRIKLMLPVKRDKNNNIVKDKNKTFSDNGYIPDWTFMQSYIKSLNYKRIKTSNKTKKCAINTSKWKDYTIRDLFPKLDVQKYSKIPDELGDIPFVSSTSNNNGVSLKVNDVEIIDECITVSTNGECLDCFYHDEPIAISTDVEILKNDKINKWSALFICTVLQCEKFKWSFGRKPKNDKIFDIVVKLPSKNINGQFYPDYQYMENYMKNLPLGDKL